MMIGSMIQTKLKLSWAVAKTHDDELPIWRKVGGWKQAISGMFPVESSSPTASPLAVPLKCIAKNGILAKGVLVTKILLTVAGFPRKILPPFLGWVAEFLLRWIMYSRTHPHHKFWKEVKKHLAMTVLCVKSVRGALEIEKWTCVFTLPKGQKKAIESQHWFVSYNLVSS